MSRPFKAFEGKKKQYWTAYGNNFGVRVKAHQRFLCGLTISSFRYRTSLGPHAPRAHILPLDIKAAAHMRPGGRFTTTPDGWPGK